MPSIPTSKRSPWTVLGLVRWTTDYFSRHRLDSARSEAEILLAHCLGVRRIDLYLNHDQPLCEDELKRFKTLIQRRVAGEPAAYITGIREFWSLEFMVGPAVLIPRPETECLVEAVLPYLDRNGRDRQRVLDMGTGSGAIVVALAHEHPEHRYVAMDRSLAALQLALRNARRHQVDRRIDWYCGDWDAPLKPDEDMFDLIVSNPPYIRHGEIDGLQREIRNHEPRMALDGSGDGLACLEGIVRSAHRYLRPGGWLALEIGCDQAAAVTVMADDSDRYLAPRIVRDYSGRDRVVVMEKVLATDYHIC
jgi:release factor glutamine methyltransferase